MKRHTNFNLPVEIGIDLNTVDKIKFVFEQAGKRLRFVYPSFSAIRDGDTNVILLRWSATDTNIFNSEKKISMDTFIKLKESADNPATEIVDMIMSPTLFTLQEVEDDD